MNKEIENEIDILNKFSENNSYSIANKIKAFEIISNITTFIELDRHNLKLSSKFFNDNASARVDLDDALENLRTYSDSKLKAKDNFYYNEGIHKLQSGITEVIQRLRAGI